MRTRGSVAKREGRWRQLGGAAAAIGVAFMVGGCPSAPPPQEGVTDVLIQGIAFTPKEVTVTVGERVRWTNLDPVLHTVTSGDPADGNAGALFDSGTLDPGESFERTFSEVGEFEYYCMFHQDQAAMRHAKVTVTEAAP